MVATHRRARPAPAAASALEERRPFLLAQVTGGARKRVWGQEPPLWAATEPP